MSLRSLKRGIARQRMKEAGIERINKRRIWRDDDHKTRAGKTVGGYASYFALHWRNFLDPPTAEYKMWAGKSTSKKRGFMRRLRV